MKKIFAFTVALAVCLTTASCVENNSLPEDTSATEQYIEQASETTQAEITTSVTTAETTPFEALSDYDKAIRLAAEYIEEHGWEHDKFILYDFDLDGIPELMEETDFKDAMGWEIHKLTGSEAVSLGDIMYAEPSERHEDGVNSLFYHGDELTLESGVHIYRDNEKDEIFYVTEHIGEGHTDGAAVGLRYDIYADKLAERELYHCDFLTWDDCGASGNRYITHNILDGKKLRQCIGATAIPRGFCTAMNSVII